MKRSGFIKRKTPLRAKKPWRPNVPVADSLMGIWGLKRVKPMARGGGFKPLAHRQPARKPVKRLPYRSKGRIANLEAECDQLWRMVVKARWGNRSAKNGGRYELESAHIVPRGHHSTRWNIYNGIPLEKTEHADFTAHNAKFIAWVREWWPYSAPTLDGLLAAGERFQPVTEDFLLGIREELRAALKDGKCPECEAAWLAGGIY